jgi:uncharacterized protein YaiL (DUF2058 family)
MSLSLRDQLLKAGLVSEKQARQAERDAHQRNRPKGGKASPPPARAPAREAQARKAARDQALNRAQQEKAAARAATAQLRQLIEQHRVPRVESDDWYNFVHAGKVRRLPVTPALRAQLVRGALVVVVCEGRYDCVPPEAATRIAERDPAAIVPLPAAATAAEPPRDDDPYKDYVVPDDLVW